MPRPQSPLFPYTTLFRSSGGALRGVDEPVRHKLLDLIGDLGPYGGPPRGRVAASRPGHGATHAAVARALRSEEHTSELQSLRHLVCRLLLEKKNYDEMRRRVGRDKRMMRILQVGERCHKRAVFSVGDIWIIECRVKTLRLASRLQAVAPLLA